MGTINYQEAIKPDTGYIRKLIENSLLADWIIRIEYQGEKTGTDDWMQWDKALFALKSAEPVLAVLKECYANNSDCAIRIAAEKVRPQTRMLYSVYKPQSRPVITEKMPRAAAPLRTERPGFSPLQPALVTS